MDIVDAVHQRKSIRAFKPDPVPQATLKEIITTARRAPSWGNTQPWEFVIVGGKKLDEIRKACTEKWLSDVEPNPEIPGPREFPEVFNARRSVLTEKMQEIRGIAREDAQQRKMWRLHGYQFFSAPNVIYICVDRAFYLQGNKTNPWVLFDCGMVAENIMLLATKYGLGTIVEIQSAAYPDILRKAFKIPDSKLIAIGIAIGYPNWGDPINEFHSDRDPLSKVATWYGFD